MRRFDIRETFFEVPLPNREEGDCGFLDKKTTSTIAFFI